MEIRKIVCDGCGVEQTELATCYFLVSDPGHLELWPVVAMAPPEMLEGYRQVEHVCGAACATKQIASWLAAHQGRRKAQPQGVVEGSDGVAD